jgi:hypothetical protein
VGSRWNAAPTHDWSPAIGTALKAGYRWLDAYCGGCRQVKPIDLACVDIHPQACMTSLILMLRLPAVRRPSAAAKIGRVVVLPAVRNRSSKSWLTILAVECAYKCRFQVPVQ